jgi:hypothetical protein
MDSVMEKRLALLGPDNFLKLFLEQGGTEKDFVTMLEEIGINAERMRDFLDLLYGDGNGILYKMPTRKIKIPDTSTVTSSEQFMLDLFRLIPNISWTSDFESDFQRMVVKSHEPYNLCAAKLVKKCSDEEIKEKLGIEIMEVTIDAAHWAMVSDDGMGKYLSHQDRNILQVKNIWGVSSKVSIEWHRDHWHLDSPKGDLYAGTQFLFRCSEKY